MNDSKAELEAMTEQSPATKSCGDDFWVCLHCKKTFPEDVWYEMEVVDGEDFPICPNCGEWNVGMYSSFGPIEYFQACDIEFLTREAKQ